MSERTRIVHGIGALVAGGAERAAVDLLIGLKQSGLNVELLTLLPRRDRVGQHWAQLLQQAGIPLHQGPTACLSFRTILWLRSQLTRDDLALFHIHLNYVERAYCLARLAHRRRYGIIRKLHNSIVPQRGWQKWVFDFSDIRLSVANGQSTYEIFKDRIKGEICMIHNGMNFHWPKQDAQTRQAARKKLQLNDQVKHVVCVGSMTGQTLETAQKAQDILIRAWNQTGLGDRGHRLHLLGAGNLQPKLQALAHSEPSVVFHGAVPHVESWLLSCDTFVLPSRWEGLPNAAIEAVGTGVSCIFSDIPPCRELETPFVRYFPTDNPSELANILQSILDAPPDVNDSEITRIRRRYGMVRPVKAYRQTYAQALASIPETEKVREQCSS
ncbi:MAG: glycosyltransferase [Planctomycetota bacterium]